MMRSQSGFCSRSTAVLLALTFGACAPKDSAPAAPSAPDTSSAPKTLADAYADHFKIGVALPAKIFMGVDRPAMKLAAEQFNRVTAENETKWKGVHATSSFDFAVADGFVRFGQRHDMEIHGHVLVWHTDQPEWLFQGANGEPATRDELLDRMKKHIDKVAGRYEGKIAYWDVVNEALEDDGSMRQSEWYKIIGEDYVEQAFAMAAEAAPTAKLVYNDYNLWMPAKRDAAIALAQGLRDKGLRVDAIGMQGHYRTGGDPTIAQVEEAIVAYKDAGFEVLISELDVDPLPYAWDRVGADVNFNVELKAELDPYASGFPAEAEEAQAQRYADLFRVFVKHSDVIESVTFWGLSDDYSWLNTWPVKGRTNYPSLFDRDLRPKKAWYAIMAVAEE